MATPMPKQSVSSNPQHLRETRVPWSDLESSIHAANALSSLLVEHIELAVRESDEPSDSLDVQGLFHLQQQTAAHLRGRYEQARSTHNHERAQL